MRYALCTLSVVPVRSGASEKSEQITQLLFGEGVEVLDRKGKAWMKVHCPWDDTIGWVDARQIMTLNVEDYQNLLPEFSYNLELIQPLASGDSFLPIPLGARLPGFDGMRFAIGTKQFTFSGQAVDHKAIPATTEMLIKLAKKYLNAPQQKGGRSPLGIDAPGLVQNVFRILGIKLPREAQDQVMEGEAVDFVELAEPGDLAFFENKAGKIHHVGILLPGNKILHVAGITRVDQLDHFGIFESGKKSYTHKLRIIRRLPLSNSPGPSDDTSKAQSESSEQQPGNLVISF